jgi:hypothetical protein
MLIWHSIFSFSKLRSFGLAVLAVCTIVGEMPGVKKMEQQHGFTAFHVDLISPFFRHLNVLLCSY